MRNLIVLCLLAPLFLVAQSGEKNFIDQNYIEVTGKHEMEIIPDRIFLGITINEKDKKGKESVEDQESQLIRGLKSIGINVDENLSVLDFYGAYTNLFLKKDEVFKQKQFELVISNVNELDRVFKLLGVLEISDARINRVDHSDIEKLKRESKISALKNAKEKAENYAVAINQTAGKALHISESSTDDHGIHHTLSGKASGVIIRGYGSHNFKNNQIEDKIVFKKIKIKAEVSAKFELI